MQRIQLSFVIFVLTFFLTPMVFLWENDFQLSLDKINEKPYAWHWIPEVVCLTSFGMFLTAVGQSCGAKTQIRKTFLLNFFTWGALLLYVNLLFLRNLNPAAFNGFVWGSLPLLGYLIEMKVAPHET